MGITITPQGGLAISVINNGLTKPITSQTLTVVNAAAVTSNATVYTNATGKTFYCTSFLISTTVDPTSSDFNLMPSEGNNIMGAINSGSKGGYCGISTNIPIFKVSSGQTVALAHGFGGGTARVSLIGWVE
jgi:hypothetical protein